MRKLRSSEWRDVPTILNLVVEQLFWRQFICLLPLPHTHPIHSPHLSNTSWEAETPSAQTASPSHSVILSHRKPFLPTSPPPPPFRHPKSLHLGRGEGGLELRSHWLEADSPCSATWYLVGWLLLQSALFWSGERWQRLNRCSLCVSWVPRDVLLRLKCLRQPSFLIVPACLLVTGPVVSAGCF